MINKHVLGVIITSGLMLGTTAANAVLLDFDTTQDGTPYTGLGDFFLADEYDGVLISTSESPTGAFVNEVDAANEGTAISGYHVNVGSIAEVTTLLELDFTTPVDSMSFDYATPAAAGDLQLTVSIYDNSGLIFEGLFPPPGDIFLSQTGATFYSGHLDFSGLGNITKVDLSIHEATIMLDNLNFNPVPVPAAVWLFGSGLIGLIGIARRKRS
jgi:hypothetical protein